MAEPGGTTQVDEAEVPSPVTLPAVVADAQTSVSLYRLQVEDTTWRVQARPRYGKAILGLLIAQNIVVFGLLTAAGVTGILPSIVPIVVAVTSATLVETAAVVQIIVTFLFREITYPKRKADSG
jgi:hypothetical protein